MSPCTKRPRLTDTDYHSNFEQEELRDPVPTTLAPPTIDDSLILFEILLDYSSLVADYNLRMMSKTDLNSKV